LFECIDITCLIKRSDMLLTCVIECTDMLLSRYWRPRYCT